MPSVAPACSCHGVAMYPNKSVGGWRCRVKVRARQNADYHRGGYIVQRRRELAGQRARILERLAELQQEAVTDVE